MTFSSKTPKTSAMKLDRLTLQSAYATPRKNQLPSNLIAKPRISARSGKPISAGELGLIAASAKASERFAIAASQNQPGADSDQDGVLDACDADDDGDLLLDASAVDSRGADIPMTGLIFNHNSSLDAQLL